jgi:hypothetical protein
MDPLTEKSWFTDPAQEKRAGPQTPLPKKELVHGSYSQKKSWSMEAAHKKRAGPRIPLKKKELIINSYSQLF